MARRVYYMDQNKQRLKQELMLSYRKARKAIDPKLLNGARYIIAAAVEQAHDESRRKEREGKPEEMVPLDRKKNLSIIMKFLEENPNNKAVRDSLIGVLKEDL
jgi:hypothetical protein